LEVTEMELRILAVHREKPRNSPKKEYQPRVASKL
jgi:hypothetical protein